MSLSELFNKHKSTSVSQGSLSDLTGVHSLESVGVLSSSLSQYDLLLPNLDFSKPENFCKYGLAEKYYEASILKICNSYPYDGSKKQKLEWRKNASYLDLYLLDKEYPKYTGSVNIGNNFGTIAGTHTGFYYTPARVEYIKVPVGLATGTIYDSSNDRESCFSFDRDGGFCVEFWLKNTSYVVPTASYQVILHAENNGQDSSSHWGFLIYHTGTTLGIQLDNTVNPATHAKATLANAFETGTWNHFLFNVTTGSVDIWKNGNKQSTTDCSINWPTSSLRDLKFTGTIGAFGSTGFNTIYGGHSVLGGNKLSASLDDIRFWRVPRTDKEIKLNWFTTVDGGYDSDELLSPNLGWYYKFNESTTQTASTDALVLDYSGRKNNGIWVGYQAGARTNVSPITNETLDPIIYFSSSDVYSFYTSKLLSGSLYDNENHGSIINQVPSFIEEEDKDNHLENLTQIIASMFDRLWFQIDALTSIKDTTYFASGSFPSEIILNAIRSNGLNINGLLDDYTLSELINQKTDSFNLESSIESIKQSIYKNIYNNLIYIMKTKGTDKSIKSVFRAFGIDDDVLKVKAYAKNSVIDIDGNKRIDTVRRKNMLDLSGKTDGQNMYGTVFSQYIPSQSSIGYFTYSSDGIFNIGYFDKTIEANIIFPYKFNIYDSNYTYLPSSNLTSSLFGLYQLDNNISSLSSTECTWQTNGYKMNVYSVQKSRESKDAKFVFELTGSLIDQIYTETEWFENVYDNTKWTFAIRFFFDGQQDEVSSYVSKLYTPYTNRRTSSINIVGLQEIAGNIVNSFSSTSNIHYFITSTENDFFYNKSKLYLGALRNNFTGAVVYPTQAKFLSMRVWNDLLSNQDIENHAYDTHNFGIHSASWNYKSLDNSTSEYAAEYKQLEDHYFPKHESLILNWDFESEYTPDSNGIFTVSSFRSSSIYSENMLMSNNEYNWLGFSYHGLGYGFNSGSVVIDKNYVIEQKNRIPTDYYSYDDISLVDDTDLQFGRQIKPIEYFYSMENNIYDVISEDILNMFSSINDFNDLFGRPADKYKTEYKDMRILKDVFFSKFTNTKIDIYKYFSYYKWLDSTISVILHKLLPFSANMDANIRNVIESHVLERNKYVWHSSLIRSKSNNIIIGNVRNLFTKRSLLNKL